MPSVHRILIADPIHEEAKNLLQSPMRSANSASSNPVAMATSNPGRRQGRARKEEASATDPRVSHGGWRARRGDAEKTGYA